MRRVISLVVVVILLAGAVACSSGKSGGEKEKDVSLYVDSDAPASISTPEATDTAQEEAGPAIAIATPEPSPQQAPATATVAPDLFLEVTSPGDETVLEASPVEVTGKTIPTAIVSVNGTLTSVDATGVFSVPLVLEQGPNFIEVVASTVDGTETSKVLSVIYALR